MSRKHKRALEHIARLEAENEKLTQLAAAAEALPASVVADGVSDAELATYQREQASRERISAAVAEHKQFVIDQHPLSGGRRPDLNVPILDNTYFEAKRQEQAMQRGFGFYSASAMYRARGGYGGTTGVW
jgi:hypothetical protein